MNRSEKWGKKYTSRAAYNTARTVSTILHNYFDFLDVLLVAGGLVSEEMFDTPMALMDNTLCTSLPNLPQKRRAGFMGMVNGSIIFCGGRSESNLPINSDCWKLDRSSRSWEASISLPRSLSRATAVGLNDTLWVFGGTNISITIYFCQNYSLFRIYNYKHDYSILRPNKLQGVDVYAH